MFPDGGQILQWSTVCTSKNSKYTWESWTVDPKCLEQHASVAN